MKKLKVDARGRVTLGKDLLQHIGVEPGQTIEVEKLPGRELAISAVRGTGSIDSFIGLLAGKTTKVLTIEEMNEVIERGWAGEN
jgi:antitoxin PrlF